MTGYNSSYSTTASGNLTIPTFTGVPYTNFNLGAVVVALDTGELRTRGPSSWVTYGGSGLTAKQGRTTISNTAKLANVSFGSPFPGTSYSVVFISEDTGSGVADTNCWASNKTANGFTANISAAPGAGNSLVINWRAVYD